MPIYVVTRPGPAVRALLLLCSAAACVATGCRQSNPDATSDAAERVTRTAEAGPVSMTLSVAPAEPVASQAATVRLDVIAEHGVTVTVDDYERALRAAEDHFEYRILGSDRQIAKPLGDGTLRWSYACQLEFVLAGEYELPPARLTFVDERGAENDSAPAKDGESPQPQVLNTEPLGLVVRDTAAPPPSPEELTQIGTLQPVELPRRLNWWWAAAATVVMVCIILLVIWLRRKRALEAERVVVIPAHEWALHELADLIAEDLMAKGRVQEFYYRISDIVRGYVERRFRVSAPEMTTEEFLAAASLDRRFGETNTRELERFLEACDRVKYARQIPRAEESVHLAEAARTFVDRTRERTGAVGRTMPASSTSGERAA